MDESDCNSETIAQIRPTFGYVDPQHPITPQ